MLTHSRVALIVAIARAKAYLKDASKGFFMNVARQEVVSEVNVNESAASF